MRFFNLIIICIFFSSVSYSSPPLSIGNVNGSIDSIRSWKDLRDESIIKQNWDYSCGSAATSTILNSFYGENLSEGDILTEVIKLGGDGTASFYDLRQAVKKFGYKGIGISLGFEKLKFLTIPVIVYLNYKDNDHFSVIRGVSEEGIVWLADSSWGNRKLSEYQFKKMWEVSDNDLKGKALLIIPEDRTKADISNDFFWLAIKQPNNNRISQFTFVIIISIGLCKIDCLHKHFFKANSHLSRESPRTPNSAVRSLAKILFKITLALSTSHFYTGSRLVAVVFFNPL